MDAIKITTKITSDTLYFKELKAFIGKNVEIIIRDVSGKLNTKKLPQKRKWTSLGKGDFGGKLDNGGMILYWHPTGEKGSKESHKPNPDDLDIVAEWCEPYKVGDKYKGNLADLTPLTEDSAATLLAGDLLVCLKGTHCNSTTGNIYEVRESRPVGNTWLSVTEDDRGHRNSYEIETMALLLVSVDSADASLTNTNLTAGKATQEGNKQMKKNPEDMNLEELVDVFNQGTAAKLVLRNVYQDRCRYTEDKDACHNYDSQIRHTIEIIPKPSFVPFTTKEGWQVCILPDGMLQIGCRGDSNYKCSPAYEVTQVRNAFKALINNGDSSYTSYFATRKGIKNKAETLNWEDAERILTQLESCV